ncbi:MAG: NADPH-dependent 7-cyano-7-deazaguanine reductase QueF, partial [Beijerinckiaceae bacterium]
MARKTLQLGTTTPVPSSPGKATLDRVPNPHSVSDYAVRFVTPEFTSLCPITGQ